MRNLNEIPGIRSIFATAIGMDSDKVAELLRLLPTLGDLERIPVDQLKRIVRVSHEEAQRIKALCHLCIELWAPSCAPEYFRSPEDVFQLLKNQPPFWNKEHFIVVVLDIKNKILAKDIISIGTLHSTLVHPREILQAVLRHNGASFVCVHNHPSGDPTPSSEDIEFTQRLAEGAQLVGVELLDHVILGDNKFVSLKEQGLF
ncbi:DNA repair protein RadC [Paenibacillus sp. 1_12]|uniref:JAB domain-containing protein n=1 Tax=Paenibacillus sp. 1_12 TaxID=1566278 RepID=UPI0008EB31D2|nr:DNA repair protein RadC [Paenibacillus sp. 1_12]SFL86913.1 DNA repair protein RadC [Paenibacillus sp. 1_12]